jgi:hypothetical protein
MTATPRFTIDAKGGAVVTIRASLSGGQSLSFLLRSDAHHDNPKCDHAMERRHLAEAVERGAGIIDAGDLFCAMQGKFDKRADKSSVRPEHQCGDYLDALVRTAADFYAPFARNWVVMGMGNHETAIRKRHETCLTTRLVERLNTMTGSSIRVGGYGGVVRCLFQVSGGTRMSRTIVYHHGMSCGHATRGTNDVNRQAIIHPDAHVVLSGHSHDSWIVPIARQRISGSGVIFRDEQLHVRTPGYKDAWGDGSGGFEVEKLLGPKPTGAAWLTFTCRNADLHLDVSRAT